MHSSPTHSSRKAVAFSAVMAMSACGDSTTGPDARWATCDMDDGVCALDAPGGLCECYPGVHGTRLSGTSPCECSDCFIMAFGGCAKAECGFVLLDPEDSTGRTLCTNYGTIALGDPCEPPDATGGFDDCGSLGYCHEGVCRRTCQLPSGCPDGTPCIPVDVSPADPWYAFGVCVDQS